MLSDKADKTAENEDNEKAEQLLWEVFEENKEDVKSVIRRCKEDIKNPLQDILAQNMQYEERDKLHNFLLVLRCRIASYK